MRKTVGSLGERKVISIITSHIGAQKKLYKGVGHDAGFLDIELGTDEVLAINTDRSGLSAAAKFGLDDGQSVGDFAISHAISDIVAAGAKPVSVAIAMLIPPLTEMDFIDNVMKGVIGATNRYDVTITGGDTKKNSEFAIVVTACGIAKKSKVLARNSVKDGDLLLVTGNLGGFLLGMFAKKTEMQLTLEEEEVIDKALIEQRPPFDLGLNLGSSGLMNACTDISDGLPAAIYNLCAESKLGCKIYDSDIPVASELSRVQKASKLHNIALSSAGGDWEYLYSISPENLNKLSKSMPEVRDKLFVIGTAEKNDKFIVEVDGQEYYLMNNENDSFKSSLSDKGHFTQVLLGMSTPIGEKVSE
ncbi:thiamine-phosphate kinase [Paraferrimonas haliotis]|uniref:thiamine-phosphate kinase n=1 Tax=Paraferrimonas haliotis TaxID=2013866 RepID=UPI000BA94903|nr:thiamine-phosphate kinase [Paraferrimonas haliotis]